MSEARDLRDLLSAALEALTVPEGADADRRVVDRAIWARVTIKGALQEPPEDLAWNAAYLRRKLDEEEARTK
ncbi:hypothetical protein ACWD5Q_15295 [Streptomyces sp. NPDC002513]